MLPPFRKYNSMWYCGTMMTMRYYFCWCLMSFEFRYCSCSTNSFWFGYWLCVFVCARSFLGFYFITCAGLVLLLFSIVASFHQCSASVRVRPHEYDSLLFAKANESRCPQYWALNISIFLCVARACVCVSWQKKRFYACVCIVSSIPLWHGFSYICIKANMSKMWCIYFRWWSTRSSGFMCIFSAWFRYYCCVLTQTNGLFMATNFYFL